LFSTPRTGNPIEQIVDQEMIEMEIIERPYGTTKEGTTKERTTKEGTTKDGHAVHQFICQNSNGYILEMINYGATITAFRAPDKTGTVKNITLGCSDLEGYQACTTYFGCTVGRFCNRIAKGKFSIAGTPFTLDTNNGENHLHGGQTGFDKRVWKSEQVFDKNAGHVGVRFTLVSEDGDQGYPGKLAVTAQYVLNDANELTIDFTAHTDQPTHVNLTNHAYWNLGGAGSGKITDHVLKIQSNQYVPVDSQSIPTGELASVEGTPFDFRLATEIGARLQDIEAQPIGYDHCYVLDLRGEKPGLAATVSCPDSGLTMEVHTTQPGLQFYTGNYLDGQPGSGGFDQHEAFCLEAQHFPDAPNQPAFGSTLLKPGQTYRQTTIHKFSVAP
jgi:aldose 1-epimerase